MTPQETIRRKLRRAIDSCREQNWWLGLQRLTALASELPPGAEMPGYYYSYLGHAIARCKGHKRQGLRLCRRAARQQPLQPENHLNLAAVHLLLRRRRAAVSAIKNGLAIDPEHPELLALKQRIGVRRRPPVAFLQRAHPVNRWLGKLTHRGARLVAARRDQKLSEFDD